METGDSVFVTTFYKFVPMDQAGVDRVQSALLDFMNQEEIKGLILVACEGLNGTVAGSEASILRLKGFICGIFPETEFSFKDSTCEELPFRWVNVDRRTEIVGLKRPDLVPEADENSHLAPSEWHQMLTSGEDIQLVDTRNEFETKIGKFKGAIDPQITKFSEWGEYLDSANLDKEKPTLIYCTGGIRCEKAILEMQNRGFEKVYQLRDGILGYLAEFPDAEYEGECFVFDERVAVDQNLKQTERFGICPGCGLTSEMKVSCGWCAREFFSCDSCQKSRLPACTKTCFDRLGRHGTEQAPKNCSPNEPVPLRRRK